MYGPRGHTVPHGITIGVIQGEFRLYLMCVYASHEEYLTVNKCLRRPNLVTQTLVMGPTDVLHPEGRQVCHSNVA